MSVEKLLLKATIFAGQGKQEEAKQLYSSILEKYPRNIKARRGIAKLAVDGSRNLSQQDIIAQLSRLFTDRKYKLVSQQAYAYTVHYPKNLYIWSFLGGALQKQQEFKKAAFAFRQVLKLNKNYPEGHNNLGIVLQELGDFEQAVTCFQKACTLKPDYSDAYYNMGIALKNWGHLQLSIDAYEKCIELAPSNWEAYANLGSVLKAIGELDRAVKAYETAIMINPNNVALVLKLGNAFDEMGQSHEAISNYQKVLLCEPHHTVALGKLILALLEQDECENAFVHCEKLITLNPADAEAHNLLGTTLIRKGFFNDGISSYKKAIQINPNFVDAENNLGNAFVRVDNLEAALEHYNRAISIKPNHAASYNNKAIALRMQGRLLESQEFFNKAMGLDPSYAEAHQNMSHVLLACQDFKLGFELSEWRWKTVERKGTLLQSPKSMWKGEINKRVLVWGEQGIGDEIMFSSMVPELCKIASTVMLHCDERLIPLFKRSFPANVEYSIRSEGVLSLNYDFHIPIGSLAKTFRTSRDSFRATSTGFLNYDKSRADQLRETILSRGATKIIGVGWNTSSALRDASKRNIKLSDLAQSLASTNTQLVSLQYGDVDEEVTRLKNDHGIEVMQMTEVDNKNDMDGLAALIMACDEVVSTTNAMVHLAGALGASTKVLLPFAPRWIWGNGSESFWYDSVIPYKQEQPGDWVNVLKSVTIDNI